MLLRLLLLLTIVPLVELTILLRIAEEFSWGSTILLIIVTGVVGAWLARREGLKVLHKIQTDLESGIAPTEAMVDGVLILAAGLVLVTPGILTDLLGFALLIPPIRAKVRHALSEAFKKRVVTIHHNGPDPFVDVVATSVEDAEQPTGPKRAQLEESKVRTCGESDDSTTGQ